MPRQELRLNLRVFFREKRPGVWIAQGVDYDLNAQGTSLEHVRHAFALTLLGQIMQDVERQREPLSALGPPPGEALEGFDLGWELEGPRELTLPAGILPPPWVISAELEGARVYSG